MQRFNNRTTRILANYYTKSILGNRLFVTSSVLFSTKNLKLFDSVIMSSSHSFNSSDNSNITYLDQKTAQAIDNELMSPEHGFSIDQLMELAGLSCACAIQSNYSNVSSSFLIVCGSGNNGGDALVCARHLYHFGYRKLTVCYPKPTEKKLYLDLQAQLKHLNIPILTDLPKDSLSEYDYIIDGIFGFSFDPSNGVREPYKSILESVVKNNCKVISIDIPSGWHVEQGDTLNIGLKPEMLISLTAPKKCAEKFTGKYHAVGGRFVPPDIAKKFKFTLPDYPSREQFAMISTGEKSNL